MSNIVNVLYAPLPRDCRTHAELSFLRLKIDFVTDVASVKLCHVDVARTTGNVTIFGGFSFLDFDFFHWAHACCHGKDMLHGCDETCQSMQYIFAADVLIYYF